MLFLKGIIIGIGKIIPGVSGSMLAISMGIYLAIYIFIVIICAIVGVSMY